jgi:hypothetical protein
MMIGGVSTQNAGCFKTSDIVFSRNLKIMVEDVHNFATYYIQPCEESVRTINVNHEVGERSM